MARIGVLSIIQETNTFAPRPTTLDDFESQGLYRGEAAARAMAGTNTELEGALVELRRMGLTPVPLARAWAMSGGPLERSALEALGGIVRAELRASGPLEGLVFSLHGAMAAEGVDDADAWLLEAAREEAGRVPIGVCLDLHANVTAGLVAASDLLVGYRTYPHVDQAATGARVAALLAGSLAGRGRPRTVLAKRPMLLPAETTQTTGGPMSVLRRTADRLTRSGVLDVSIFPVQPWLDVAELGLAVTVTVDEAIEPADGGRAEGGADPADAQGLADDLAELAWSMRESFRVDLVAPEDAIRAARHRSGEGPLLVSESADSPTAGASADSPAMVAALLQHGDGLRALVTLVDGLAVARCHAAVPGETLELRVGASIEGRYHRPVALAARLERIGDGLVRLAGPAFEGMEVSMGRWAVVTSGGLSVLLTERPAPTFDPASYRSVGLEPASADLVAVRSANLFRAGWASVSERALILDLPGASTPRLETLRFERAPRPMYPIDPA